MESHLQQTHDTHGQHYEDNQLTPGQPIEDEPPVEKKSMMTKVKDKARKIKNSIKKYRQGDQEIPQDDEEEDDDDDNDEETVEDRDVHGAPVDDSTRVSQGGPDAIVANPRGNLEKPVVMTEDAKPVTSSQGMPQPTAPKGVYGTGSSQPSGLDHDQGYDQEASSENLERPLMGQESYSKPVTSRDMLTPVSEGAHDTGVSEPSGPDHNKGHGEEINSLNLETMPKPSHDMPPFVSEGAHDTGVSEPSGPDHGKEHGEEINSVNLETMSEKLEDRYSMPEPKHDMPPFVSEEGHDANVSEPSGMDHNKGHGEEINSVNLETMSEKLEDRYSMPESKHDMPPFVSEDAHDTGVSEPSGPDHNKGHGEEINSINLEKMSEKLEDRYSMPESKHDMPPFVSSGADDIGLSKPSDPGHTKGHEEEINSVNLETMSEKLEDRYSMPESKHDMPPFVSSEADDTGLSQPSALGHNQGHGQEVNSENLERSSEDHYSKPVTSEVMPPPVSTEADDTGLFEPSGPGNNEGYGEVNSKDLERPPVMADDGYSKSMSSEKWSEMADDGYSMSATSHGTPQPISPGINDTEMTDHDGYSKSVSSENLEKSSEMADDGYSKPNQGYDEEVNSENLKSPSPMEEDSYSKPVTSHDMPPPVSTVDHDTGLSQPSGHGDNQGYDQEVNSEVSEKSSEMVEDAYSKPVTSQPEVVPSVHSPKDPSIYGSEPATKVANQTNPSDTQEDISKLQDSFDKMGTDSEPKTLDHNQPETLIGNPSNEAVTHQKSVEDKPMGTVAESDEVRPQPETVHEQEDVHDSGNVVADKSMTEKVRYAVSSWFGGKEEPTEGTLGTSNVTDKGLEQGKG